MSDLNENQGESPLTDSFIENNYSLPTAEGIGMPVSRMRVSSKEDPVKLEMNLTLRQARKQLKEEGKSHSPQYFPTLAQNIGDSLIGFLNILHQFLFNVTEETVEVNNNNIYF